MEGARFRELSIIIPTHNRKESLRRCLISLDNQDYPKDRYEIIVIDDGSSDGTEEMTNSLTKGLKNLRYIKQDNQGPAVARNRGIKESKGEIVAFTDDDCFLGKDWVRKMISAHSSDSEVTAVGGLTRVDNSNIKAMVSQSLSNWTIKASINGKEEVIFFPTCNVSIKKSYLNGERFNESFPLPAGEDLEFFWRLFKKGRRFIYKDDIEVLHDCHPEFRSFLRQAYMYGRGNYLVQYLCQDHHVLKEIKTKNGTSFLAGLIINIIKIPRFVFLLGRRLIRKQNGISLLDKSQVYLYFTMHKIMYLIGNIVEHRRVKRISLKPLKERLIKPEFIILDITHRCNINCNICEIRKDGPIREFTTNEVMDLIEQAIEWKVPEFILSGGEPFTRTDIFQILDFVYQKRYRIGILTNGVMLDDNLIQRLLPFLSSGTLSLSISLDSITPDIHDDIRGAKGCYEKTLYGLKILSGLKKDHPDINFNIISVILNENLEGLLPLAEFLKSLNVNSMQFQPLLANNLIMQERSNTVKYWVMPERLTVLDRAIDELVDFKKRNFSLVRNSENNLKLVKKYFRGTLRRNDIRCLYATRTMLIANNADVTTCFGCYGNVRRERLKEIFYSQTAQRQREKVKGCARPCLLPCFTDN